MSDSSWDTDQRRLRGRKQYLNMFYLHDVLLSPPPLPPSQLTCPVTIDQLSLLQLLSSHATQEFRYYGGTSRVDFVGTNGEPIEVHEDGEERVSNTFTQMCRVCTLFIDPFFPPFFQKKNTKTKTTKQNPKLVEFHQGLLHAVW